MEVDLIFKIAAIGIIVAVLNQVVLSMAVWIARCSICLQRPLSQRHRCVVVVNHLARYYCEYQDYDRDHRHTGSAEADADASPVSGKENYGDNQQYDETGIRTDNQQEL